MAPRRVHVFRVGGGVLDWRSSQGDPSRPIDVSSDPRRRSASAIGVCQSESFGPSQSIRVRRSVSGDPSQEIRVCRPESSPADPTQVSRFLACLGGFTRLWLLSQPSNPWPARPSSRVLPAGHASGPSPRHARCPAAAMHRRAGPGIVRPEMPAWARKGLMRAWPASVMRLSRPGRAGDPILRTKQPAGSGLIVPHGRPARRRRESVSHAPSRVFHAPSRPGETAPAVRHVVVKRGAYEGMAAWVCVRRSTRSAP